MKSLVQVLMLVLFATAGRVSACTQTVSCFSPRGTVQLEVILPITQISPGWRLTVDVRAVNFSDATLNLSVSWFSIPGNQFLGVTQIPLFPSNRFNLASQSSEAQLLLSALPPGEYTLRCEVIVNAYHRFRGSWDPFRGGEYLLCGFEKLAEDEGEESSYNDNEYQPEVPPSSESAHRNSVIVRGADEEPDSRTPDLTSVVPDRRERRVGDYRVAFSDDVVATNDDNLVFWAGYLVDVASEATWPFFVGYDKSRGDAYVGLGTSLNLYTIVQFSVGTKLGLSGQWANFVVRVKVGELGTPIQYEVPGEDVARQIASFTDATLCEGARQVNDIIGGAVSVGSQVVHDAFVTLCQGTSQASEAGRQVFESIGRSASDVTDGLMCGAGSACSQAANVGDEAIKQAIGIGQDFCSGVQNAIGNILGNFHL